MNIFEALEKGNGKATIAGNLNLYYVVYENGRFHARSIGLPAWLLPQEVPYSALQHNDWRPYVPPKERKIEGMVNFVPRGTCSSCGQALPPQKVKHKEVFEGVCWFAWPRKEGEEYVMYPNVDVDKRHKYIGKPPMKMTLEWEE